MASETQDLQVLKNLPSCRASPPPSLTGTEFYWFVTKIPTRMQTTRGTAGIESATFQLQIRRPITITTHCVEIPYHR